MNKKICFIAQFPPPIHGLSKAVDTLYNSELKEEFEFEKVDITNNKKFIKLLKAINKVKKYKIIIISNKQNKKIYKIIISAKESTYFL